MKKKDTLDAVLRRIISEQLQDPSKFPVAGTSYTTTDTNPAPTPNTDYLMGRKPIPKNTPESKKRWALAERIVNTIIESKGSWYSRDIEENVIPAIKKIPDLKTFEIVQYLIQKRTGKYLAAFLQTFMDYGYAGDLSFVDVKKTEALLQQVIDHLIKIGAWTNTIEQLQAFSFTTQQRADENTHLSKGIMSLAAFMFIPPPAGPIIAAGLGVSDAKDYWDQNDPETAAIMAVLSLVPAGASLGKWWLSNTAKKIAMGGRLTKAEAQIAVKVLARKQAIKVAMQRSAQKAVASGKIPQSVLDLATNRWSQGIAQIGVGLGTYGYVLPAGTEKYISPLARKAFNATTGGGTVTQKDWDQLMIAAATGVKKGNSKYSKGSKTASNESVQLDEVDLRDLLKTKDKKQSTTQNDDEKLGQKATGISGWEVALYGAIVAVGAYYVHGVWTKYGIGRFLRKSAGFWKEEELAKRSKFINIYARTVRNLFLRIRARMNKGTLSKREAILAADLFANYSCTMQARMLAAVRTGELTAAEATTQSRRLIAELVDDEQAIANVINSDYIKNLEQAEAIFTQEEAAITRGTTDADYQRRKIGFNREEPTTPPVNTNKNIVIPGINWDSFTSNRFQELLKNVPKQFKKGADTGDASGLKWVNWLNDPKKWSKGMAKSASLRIYLKLKKILDVGPIRGLNVPADITTGDNFANWYQQLNSKGVFQHMRGRQSWFNRDAQLTNEDDMQTIAAILWQIARQGI